MAKVSKELVAMINEQINAELESAYIYLEITNYYRFKGMNGFANWFTKQYKEEMEHAEKFMHYLHQEGEQVVLKDVRAPKHEFKSDREPLELQLGHEELVTSLIYKLMDKALEEKDYRTESLLRWYVDEQTEEEEHARDLLEMYDVYAKDNIGLIRMDEKLAQR